MKGKSYIQSLQVKVTEEGKLTYKELTITFKNGPRKGRKFRGTNKRETNFRLLRERLCSNWVRVTHDLERKTMGIFDVGPEGAQVTWVRDTSTRQQARC